MKIKPVVGWLVLLPVWQDLRSPGRRKAQLKRYLSHTGLWACLWEMVLNNEWLMWLAPFPGGWIWTRQWVSQSETFLCGHCLQIPVLSSCLDFPKWRTDYYLEVINLFLPELLLVRAFYHSGRNEGRTYIQQWSNAATLGKVFKTDALGCLGVLES